MAAGHSPMAQFEVHKLIPIEIGGYDVSFTNASLFMMLAVVCGSLLLVLGVKRDADKDRGDELGGKPVDDVETTGRLGRLGLRLLLAYGVDSSAQVVETPLVRIVVATCRVVHHRSPRAVRKPPPKAARTIWAGAGCVKIIAALQTAEKARQRAAYRPERQSTRQT